MPNRKLRVVYIQANYSGMLHYLVQLANAMSQYAEVTVLAPKGVDRSYFVSTVNVREVFDFSAVKKPGIFQKTANLSKLRIIEEIKPDIIHITDLQPIVAFGIYIHGYSKHYPLVYTDHDISAGSHADNVAEKVSESLGARINKLLIDYDMHIVHGDFLKSRIIVEGVPEDKVGVVPHGSYTLFADRCYGKKVVEEKNTVLFFGFLKKYKGLEYLIKAVPQVQLQIPQVKVIIAGQGDLRRYFRSGNIPPVFEVHNKLIPDSDVEELFSRSQLLVLPYVEASQSGPLHIALAAGKPVVATDVGSLPEVVKDGWNGLIVKPKDEKALANAIVSLLKNDTLRATMGMNAYKLSKNQLSWDNIAKITLNLYKKVLQRRLQTGDWD